MKKIWQFITKQYDTGLWFGAANSLITNTVSFAAPFTPIIGLGTFYGVWRDEITARIPWLSAAWVMIFLGIGIAGVFLMEWKFIIPAKMRYNNWIAAKHGNVILQCIAVQDKNIKAICKKLGVEYHGK